MSATLRSRLLGLVVVAALAAIFLPMVLSESDQSQDLSLDLNMPAPPVVPVETREISLRDDATVRRDSSSGLNKQLAGGKGSSTPTPVMQPPVASGKPAVIKAEGTAGNPQKSASVRSAAAPKPAGDVQPASQPANGGQTRSASSSTQAAVASASAQTPPTAIKRPTNVAVAVNEPPQDFPGDGEKAGVVQGWVVQVASFSQQDNANKTRDKLRRRSQAAFVTSADVNGRTWYRVRVGPFRDKAAAEIAAKDIASGSKFKPKALRYP